MSSSAMKKPTLMVAKANTFAAIGNSPGCDGRASTDIGGRRAHALVDLAR